MRLTVWLCGWLYGREADWDVSGRRQEENPDLFYSVFWSYGTLGFLTAVQVRIVPALPYVRLRYQPVHGRRQLTARLAQISGGRHQFLETLLFDRDRAVIMTGEFVSRADQAAEPHKVRSRSGSDADSGSGSDQGQVSVRARSRPGHGQVMVTSWPGPGLIQVKARIRFRVWMSDEPRLASIRLVASE